MLVLLSVVLLCVVIGISCFKLSCKDTAILPKNKVFVSNSLPSIRLSQCFISLCEVACHELSDEGSSEASQCVECKVEPVGGACRGERLLADLYESAEEDGCYHSPGYEARCLGLLVAFEILEPQYAAESEVHEEVQHLIDV